MDVIFLGNYTAVLFAALSLRSEASSHHAHMHDLKLECQLKSIAA